jgi:hypothetical protein
VRAVVHLITRDQVDELARMDLTAGPLRVVAFGRAVEGAARLASLRRALEGRGVRYRLSGTPARLYIDTDPELAEVPTVALCMIARSDAAGLERAILTALPYVDQVVVGVDGRSDNDTLAVALAYADQALVFEAQDLRMAPDEWAADRMDFASARNLVLASVTVPWALTVDTDEFVRVGQDIRPILRQALPTVGAFEVAVSDRGSVHRNFQRLARSSFRWWSAAHNQLATAGTIDQTSITLELEHTRDLRAAAETARRDAQRHSNIEQLRAEADAGEVNALYHLAMHLVGTNLEEAIPLVERYRLLLEVQGPCADQRANLAMAVAVTFYNRDDIDRADQWATRVLLDGPRPEAFCLKGDIAEDRGQLKEALVWYEAACAAPDVGTFRWAHVTCHKLNRREGIRRALAPASAA